MKGKPELLEALCGNGQLKLGFGAKFAIVLAALAILSVTSLAQEMTSEDWYKKGLDLSNNGSYEEAVKAYDKAIEIDPNCGNAWMGKGYSLHYLAVFDKNLSMYDESLKAFDRAIELIPDNDTRNLALAWDGRAIALMDMGNALEDAGGQDEARARREEALASYERAIDLDPDFTGLEARLYKASILADLGRYNESIDAFDEIIETSPANDTLYAAIVLADKGIVLENMGDHEEALNAFDRALVLDPSNMIAMQGKGTALQSLGRISKAEAAFAKAKELGYEE